MDITDAYIPVTYKQDASKDRHVVCKYDCVIALETFEHLEKGQAKAFQEALKVTNNIILSLPYKLNCPGDCHHGIDEEVIEGWTGIKPTTTKVVGNKIVLHYNNIP